jgi:hypothetical protein
VERVRGHRGVPSGECARRQADLRVSGLRTARIHRVISPAKPNPDNGPESVPQVSFAPGGVTTACPATSPGQASLQLDRHYAARGYPHGAVEPSRNPG